MIVTHWNITLSLGRVSLIRVHTYEFELDPKYHNNVFKLYFTV